MSHHTSPSSGEGGLPPVSIDLQQLPPCQLGTPLVSNNLILCVIGLVVLVRLSYKKGETIKFQHVRITWVAAAWYCDQQSGLWSERVVGWWWWWNQLSSQQEDHLASVAIWPGDRQEADGCPLSPLSPLRGFYSSHRPLSSSIPSRLWIFGK